ncbi:Ig-like domain-containing protein, partial [Acinetobacter sp. 1207_04]
PITGETEPGAEVIVKLPDGTTVTTVADSKGHWEVPANPDLKDGDVVEVIAKDPAGNEGTAQEEVDGKAPIIDIDPIKPG